MKVVVVVVKFPKLLHPTTMAGCQQGEPIEKGRFIPGRTTELTRRDSALNEVDCFLVLRSESNSLWEGWDYISNKYCTQIYTRLHSELLIYSHKWIKIHNLET